MKQLEEMSFHDIGFSPRLANVLEEGLGIIYVADLCKFSAADLLVLPNFANKLLTQVRTGLASVGAHLVSDEEMIASMPVCPVRARYVADDEAFG